MASYIEVEVLTNTHRKNSGDLPFKVVVENEAESEAEKETTSKVLINVNAIEIISQPESAPGALIDFGRYTILSSETYESIKNKIMGVIKYENN